MTRKQSKVPTAALYASTEAQYGWSREHTDKVVRRITKNRVLTNTNECDKICLEKVIKGRIHDGKSK